MLDEDAFTAYRSLIKPTGEKDPWGEDYYRDLDKIDEELIPSGPLSERPSAPPDGVKWYLTDEEALTRYDGDAGEWTRHDHTGETISPTVLFTDSVRVYVRSTGSDSNDGLSESSPKATVQAALDDAPLHGDSSTLLTIDIGDGSFDEGGVRFTDRSANHVRLVGNGSGSTTLTDDNNSSSFLVRCESARVTVQGMTLDGGDTAPFCAIDNSQMNLVDVVAQNGGLNGGRVFGSSQFHMDSDSVVDQSTTSAGGQGTLNIADSVVTVDGTVRGHSGNSVIKAYANATVFFAGTLEGEGSENTTIAFQLNEASHVKLAGGSTVSGVLKLFQARQDSTPKVLGAPTMTDVTFRWELNSSGGYDQERGYYLKTLPTWGSAPSTSEFGSGLMQGAVGYNTNSGFFDLWSREHDQWLDAGRAILYDNTIPFAGGETNTAGVGETGGSMHVTAVPANNTGNPHGYDAQLYHDGSGTRWRVTETENEGGGDARIIVYKLL